VGLCDAHLLPLLTRKDVARLRRTCKTLRGMVHECFIGDIGSIELMKLHAALTSFPRAAAIGDPGATRWPGSGLSLTEREALAEWLGRAGIGARSRRSQGMLAMRMSRAPPMRRCGAVRSPRSGASLPASSTRTQARERGRLTG
jgi:hypothetical protein